jgi:hypothetical protein
MDRARRWLLILLGIIVAGCTAARETKSDRTATVSEQPQYWSEQDRDQAAKDEAEAAAKQARRKEERQRQRDRDRYQDETRSTAEQMRQDGKSTDEIRRYHESRLRREIQTSSPPSEPSFLNPPKSDEPEIVIPLPTR